MQEAETTGADQVIALDDPASLESLEPMDAIADTIRNVKMEIRTRAYGIYLGRGAQPGYEVEGWLQAERELDGD
jgi:hypothetical protein